VQDANISGVLQSADFSVKALQKELARSELLMRPDPLAKPVCLGVNAIQRLAKLEERVFEVSQAIHTDPIACARLIDNSRPGVFQRLPFSRELLPAQDIRPPVDVEQGSVLRATAACELTQMSNWVCLDTLAMAYAGDEQFVTAVKYAKTAIHYAPQDNRAELQERLRLYQEERPYRLE
jgi:hypothetical protein